MKIVHLHTQILEWKKLMNQSYQKNSKKKLRVLFMGNPGYGGPFFSELLKQDVEIVAAFTKSNSIIHNMKKFIKLKLNSTKKLSLLSKNLIEKLELFKSKRPSKSNFNESIERYAEKEKVKVFDGSIITKDANISIIEKWNIDLVMVATFSEFLSDKMLKLPKYGCINMHPSLLPKYRGGFPEFCTIYDGNKTTGITFHLMESKFDTGPIIHQKSINLLKDTNTIDLKKRLCKLACNNIGTVLSKVQLENPKMIKQINSNVSYCKLHPNSRLLDNSMSVSEIKNKILAHRGDNFYPYFFIRGEKVRVLSYGNQGYCFNATDGKIYIDQILFKKKIYSGEYVNNIIKKK